MAVINNNMAANGRNTKNINPVPHSDNTCINSNFVSETTLNILGNNKYNATYVSNNDNTLIIFPKMIVL